MVQSFSHKKTQQAEAWWLQPAMFIIRIDSLLHHNFLYCSITHLDDVQATLRCSDALSVNVIALYNRRLLCGCCYHDFCRWLGICICQCHNITKVFPFLFLPIVFCWFSYYERFASIRRTLPISISVHHNKIKDALLVSMKHMNMNRFVFVGEEVKDKSKVFKYLRHNWLYCDVSDAKIRRKIESCIICMAIFANGT